MQIIHGADLLPKDIPELESQLAVIENIFKDSQWHTMQEITARTGFPMPSVSAQIRNMRKKGFIVTRKRLGNVRVWSYRLDGTGEPPKRKLRPLGNEVLWGELLRSIYAYSAKSDIENYISLEKAALSWAVDMSRRV